MAIREKVDLGEANADVRSAYELARAEAKAWHWYSAPWSLSIGCAANDQLTLTASFRGKTLFQRFTDVLTVEVDMRNMRVLGSGESRGGLEPNYGAVRPLGVTLRTPWRRVKDMADEAYGDSFKQHHGDTHTSLLIEFDGKWYVTYISDPAGAYAHLQVYDETAHESLAGKVKVSSSGKVDREPVVPY